MKRESPLTACFLLVLSAFVCCPLLTCGGSSIASSKHGKSRMSSRLQELLDDEVFDISLPSSEEKKKANRRPWQKKKREEADSWPEINGTTLRQMQASSPRTHACLLALVLTFADEAAAAARTP